MFYTLEREITAQRERGGDSPAALGREHFSRDMEGDRQQTGKVSSLISNGRT